MMYWRGSGETAVEQRASEEDAVKRIKNATIMNPFNGRPIDVTYDFRRDAAGAFVRDAQTGEPLYPITTPQTTALLIRTFISNFPAKDATMDDSHKALRILDAIRPFKLLEAIDADYVAPQAISLEDAEFEWLVAKYKATGAQVHGVAYGALYLKAIEDVVKDEPKGKDETPRAEKRGKILSGAGV